MNEGDRVKGKVRREKTKGGKETELGMGKAWTERELKLAGA